MKVTTSSTSRLVAFLALILWLAPLAVAPSRAQASRRRGTGGGKKSKHKPGTLEHFAEFCRRFIVLDNGKPLELEGFQRLILRGFFAGVTEILVLLPKKNGKTTLLAALALYHLIYTPDARCYIAASAKDQAKVMYDQACGFVERKDSKGKLLPQAAALQKRVLLRKATKEIRSRRDSGFVWVCSGDVNTVDGVIVTLGLVDELHRHKDGGRLYGVLVDGTGPRNGQVVTISTPGETMKSVLGRALKAALKMPGLTRKGKYTYVRSPEGDFELHQWGLDPEDDREDLRLVKQANPLSNVTIKKLGIRKKSPFMTGSRWARFGCGVWMAGDDAALSQIDIGKCRMGAKSIKRGAEVYVGLDVGLKWDTTAIVPMEVVSAEERRVRYGPTRILRPPRDGTSMRRKTIIDAVLELRDKRGYVIESVVFDRNAEGEGIAQELEDDHDIRVIQHSQDPSPMADASMGFAEGIGNQTVELPDDDEFISHLLAAVAQTTSGEKWRFVAPAQGRGSRKKGQRDQDDVEFIDAAIAAAMVRRIALDDEGAPAPIDPSDYRIVTV